MTYRKLGEEKTMRTALDFARWLQSLDVQVIGEDVNIKDLYERWNGDRRCNHDAVALTSVEILQCECGAVVTPPEWQQCRHCGEDIESDPDNGWIHSEDGVVGCGLADASDRELYAEPADA
jgi:hypothetical protein